MDYKEHILKQNFVMFHPHRNDQLGVLAKGCRRHNIRNHSPPPQFLSCSGFAVDVQI